MQTKVHDCKGRIVYGFVSSNIDGIGNRVDNKVALVSYERRLNLVRQQLGCDELVSTIVNELTARYNWTTLLVKHLELCP